MTYYNIYVYILYTYIYVYKFVSRPPPPLLKPNGRPYVCACACMFYIDNLCSNSTGIHEAVFVFSNAVRLLHLVTLWGMIRARS